MAKLILNPKTADVQIIDLDQSGMRVGSSEDADIQLADESLAEQCARIETKPDGCYIIDLGSGGVTVNGEEISFQRLHHGDQILFGSIPAEIHLADRKASEQEPDAEETQNEFMPVAFAGANGLATRPQGPSVCPQCGFPLSPGMASCPQCGLSLSNLPAMPMGYIPPVPPEQSGPGILPIIAFLAALTVVGAPIALVLGLMSLSAIRKRGGTVRDRALSKWSVGLGLVWLMVGAAAGARAVSQAHQRKMIDSIEVQEAQVIRALKNLACAQRYAQTVEFFDADSDGHGEYGNLSMLSQMQSPFFDANIADGEAYGYRFTIHEASEGQFKAVAEPVRYGQTGTRTFIIDQLGQIRGGDAGGKRYTQIKAMLPALQGERSAYYEKEDEIAQDVLSYIQTLSSSLEDQEKKQRIVRRLRKEYSLTSVGRELEGMEATVDKFVTEQRAQIIHWEAKEALENGNQDVAFAKLMELQNEHPSFSKIAAVERELSDVRSAIAQQREEEAMELFMQAEEMERTGQQSQEVQLLYQRIEKLYPNTEVAERIAELKPELKRQMRESDAEDLFSRLMELSPETEYDQIVYQANQFRRNYGDTDLFVKIEDNLIQKERKARAISWRAQTKENIQEGRMRVALAQLEAAVGENPDLQYDLQDLFILLYRNVAKQTLEEKDIRTALDYYSRLDRILQTSGSDERVDETLLAKLHSDVGQADYEQKQYSEARWHLASAAWRYDDDPQFNLRLGAASLYSGLYRPAEAAFTQALDIRPEMQSARLYRAYMNMRLVLAFENVLARGIGADELLEDDDEEEEESVSDEEQDAEDVDVKEDAGEKLDEDGEEENNADENKKNSEPARGSIGSSSTIDPKKPIVPEPGDLDLIIHYDYDSSRKILPELLQFLLQVQETTTEFAIQLRDAKPEEMAAIKLKQLLTISELRNQMSELRITHLEDLDAQKELCVMIEEMKERAHAVTVDIEAAGKGRRVQSLSRHLLPQIKTKCSHLFNAAELVANNIDAEIRLREKVFKQAEEALRKISSSSREAGYDVSRLIRNQFNRTDGTAEIDRAMLALRDSMEVEIGLQDILHAAEGRDVNPDP